MLLVKRIKIRLNLMAHFQLFSSLSSVIALIVAASILAVGSVACVNVIAGVMFSNSPLSFSGGRRYFYHSPESEELRRKIKSYPSKLHYLVRVFSIIYVGVIIVVTLQDGVISLLLYLQIDSGNGIYSFVHETQKMVIDFVVPLAIAIAVGVCGYTVNQVRQIFSGLLGEYDRVVD